MKDTLRGLMAAFERRHLWIVAGFIFLYYFSPGHEHAALLPHDRRSEILARPISAYWDRSASAGWVVGALLYRRFFDNLTLKNLLNLSIAIGTVTTLAFLLFWNEPAAAIISFCAGFSAMLATVATVTLAADYCPRRAEGFSFAVLMSIINLANTLGDNVGSYLYTHVFHRSLAAAYCDFGGVYRFCLRAGAAVAPRRQAAGRAGGACRERMEPTALLRVERSVGRDLIRPSAVILRDRARLLECSIMRKIGAFIAIGGDCRRHFASPPPAAAFRPAHRAVSYRLAVLFSALTVIIRSICAPTRHDVRHGSAEPSQAGVTSALLYPNLALPAIFQNVFWPNYASPWPFGYQRIFSTAFAKMPASEDQRLCQPSVDANAIVGRIVRARCRRPPDQRPLLQKLGGALGAASGYPGQSVPETRFPPSPSPRLQLMESQIEELTMAIDIVRQPLQDFEQSLNDEQKAKFAAVAASPPAVTISQSDQDQASHIAPSCGGSTRRRSIGSIEQIDRSVQPTDAQRAGSGRRQTVLRKAAQRSRSALSDDGAGDGGRPAGRIEARLDATWRRVLSIQVALANFETKLDDGEQKGRFDADEFRRALAIELLKARGSAHSNCARDWRSAPG